MAETTNIRCPECSGLMRLRNSRFGPFYGCENFPDCRATHGAHPDGRPLGTPANSETKRARIAAHAAFDGLWAGAADMYPLREPRGSSEREKAERRIRRVARHRAYVWLSERLGIPFDDCHIGAFDLGMCRRAIEACFKVTPFEVRRWHKSNIPMAVQRATTSPRPPSRTS